jgi:signal transduction histidine kinase
VLVASGFALLLGLGILTNIIMMAGLKETVVRAQASQTSALEVRAAVRSLRADYLESGDAVSRALLDPLRPDLLAAKREADANAEKHLASAESATQRPDLRNLLATLRWHDTKVTNRIEGKLLTLARTDAPKARTVYLTRYLAARSLNMKMVEQALAMAHGEVAAAVHLTESEAQRTLMMAWLTLGVFGLVGTGSGLLLSGAVRSIASRFEHAAAKVTEQRDHLQAVMTAMQDALIVVDAAGVVTTVNDATCTLLGWPREALLGRPIAFLMQVGDDGQTFSRARDGAYIPVAVSVAQLHEPAGNVVGAVWVAHDMRDHLRMLAEVAASRDAALEGSRIKSEFLANVSHEIRTPMNVVIGYVDIVLESPLSIAQRGYLDRVRRSAVDLLDIINDVLDISKVEAGKLTVERVPFGLRAVVNDVVGTLAIRAEEKQLALAVVVDPAVPDRITGDPIRLRQVVLNLVSNAIKFTDQGEVIVRVTREVADGADDPVLHFSIVDTGIGIPTDKQELIFQAFTQADGSMSRRYGGTGLGLTIAARLVGLMGGRIWVDSTPGRGSVFHFTIETDLDSDGLAA